MTYKQEIFKKLTEHQGDWIEFERPEHLGNLNDLADELVTKGTVEGFLAALLIYQQLCEELIRILIKDCQFLIQLSIFPSEIRFPENKKTTFGQLIEELKSTVSFNDKDEFIEKCSQLNRYRIDIVHHLTKKNVISDIKRELSNAKVLHDRIFELFDKAHDDFRGAFKDYKDDLPELFEDEFEN